MKPRYQLALTRSSVAVLLVLSLLLAMRPALTPAQEATTNAEPLFTGETFVGETSDPDTYVAIVLGGVDGEEARPARGYLCDGDVLAVKVWLEGELTGNQLSLTADDGSRLSGMLNSSGIGGVASLGSGDDVLFTAAPATGLAGLYTVELLPDGRLQGSTSEGADLAGALKVAEATDDGWSVYDVTVAGPDGEATELAFSAETPEGEILRTIVLPDGRAKGRESKKHGTHFSSRDVDWSR